MFISQMNANTPDYKKKAAASSFRNLESLALSYDTSPERIIQLMEMDRQNRIAILSESMMLPLPGTDANDTNVYCPNCNKTLSGGWPDDDTYGLESRVMYQCPHCGQAINPYHTAITLRDIRQTRYYSDKTLFFDKNGTALNSDEYDDNTQVLCVTNPAMHIHHVTLNIEI